MKSRAETFCYFRGKPVKRKWPGRDNGVLVGIPVGNRLTNDFDIRIGTKFFGDFFRKKFAVYRKRAARRHFYFVGDPDKFATEQTKFGFQKPGRGRQKIAFKRITANEFAEIVRLMRGRFFVRFAVDKPYFYSARRKLQSRFRTGKSRSYYGNAAHFLVTSAV